MFAGAGGVPGLDEFIPDAEPPDEREREQRRLVMEIVENTASGQTMKNSRIRNLANPPACGGTAESVAVFPIQGRFRNRLAAAAQQNTANSVCRAANVTIPASFEPVRCLANVTIAP